MNKKSIDLTKPLVVDGILQLPLYHGTSSLWLDSILTHGLGGAMPPLEHARTLLIDLYNQTPEEQRDYGTSLMLEQKQEHTNWQHGQVYFSLGFQDAANYALNPLGSELLTECERYVAKVKPGVLPAWFEWLRNKKRRPIVIRADDVTINQLEPEVASRGGVEIQLAELIEAQDAGLQEFRKIEKARESIKTGLLESLSPEEITLALLNPGIALEKFMHDRLWVYFSQNTFRLKKGLSIERDRLEIIELDGNPVNI
jgi:hypothetical protein